MRREMELFPETAGDPGPETFPDSFAWDTYLRVSALAGLAEEFPKHLQHSARQMHGWPMIVSHHIDGRAEFERVAGRLELGADYPLNVAPRKKRGTETPLLRYLEPHVWRLHILRENSHRVGRNPQRGGFRPAHLRLLVGVPRPETRAGNPAHSSAAAGAAAADAKYRAGMVAQSHRPADYAGGCGNSGDV